MSKNYTKEKSPPNNINIVIGNNLKRIRKAKYLTLQKLADHVGLTYQALQKQQAGETGISSSLLYQYAQLLDTPIQDFFDEVSERSQIAQANDYSSQSLNAIELFNKIKDKKIKKKILDLLASINQIDG